MRIAVPAVCGQSAVENSRCVGQRLGRILRHEPLETSKSHVSGPAADVPVPDGGEETIDLRLIDLHTMAADGWSVRAKGSRCTKERSSLHVRRSALHDHGLVIHIVRKLPQSTPKTSASSGESGGTPPRASLSWRSSRVKLETRRANEKSFVDPDGPLR